MDTHSSSFGYGTKYDFTKRYFQADAAYPIRRLPTHTRSEHSSTNRRKTTLASALEKAGRKCSAPVLCRSSIPIKTQVPAAMIFPPRFRRAPIPSARGRIMRLTNTGRFLDLATVIVPRLRPRNLHNEQNWCLLPIKVQEQLCKHLPSAQKRTIQVCLQQGTWPRRLRPQPNKSLARRQVLPVEVPQLPRSKLSAFTPQDCLHELTQ